MDNLLLIAAVVVGVWLVVQAFKRKKIADLLAYARQKKKDLKESTDEESSAKWAYLMVSKTAE